MCIFVGPVEHRRDRLEAELRAGPAEVGFQNLAHVHTARHAQRIEHDLHRCAVSQERHVFHRQDLRDHALVTVPAGHLVADRDHALRGDVDLHHLQHAAAELVAALHRIQLAVAGVDRFFDGRPQLLVDALGVLLPLRAADVDRVELERLRPLGHVTRVLAVHQRVAVVVGQLAPERRFELGDDRA